MELEINEFIKGLAEQFDETDASALKAETNYQELDEWSSLTAMSIIAFVKTQYNKAITGKEIRSCETVEELFELIQSK